MQQPCFSIIIPVYNVGKYIQRAYNSIQKQSLMQIEIIFVNDNSSDDSLKIIEGLSKKDSRIRIVNRNQTDVHGAGISRNIGFRESKGKYIYFMDGDDYLDDNTLPLLENKLEEINPDILIFGFRSLSGVDNRVTYSSSQSPNSDFININEEERVNIITDTYFNNSLYVVWNKIYSRDFLVRNNIEFPNTRTAQDAFFNLIALSKVNKVRIICNHFYNYVSDRKGSNQNICKSKFADEQLLINEVENILHAYKNNMSINKLLMFEKIRILKTEVNFTTAKNPMQPWTALRNKTEFKEMSSGLSIYQSVLYDKTMKSLFNVLFLKYPSNVNFKIIKYLRILKTVLSVSKK